MADIVTVLQSLDWSRLGGGGLIVAAVLALLAKKFQMKLPVVGSLLAGDPDVADLKALQRLAARAARRRCPQLQAAVRSIEVAFFNEAAAAEVEPQ